MSIQDTLQKINILARKANQAIFGELFVVIIIILVGLAGFGLGRLSYLFDSRPPITITSMSLPINNTEAGEGVTKPTSILSGTSQIAAVGSGEELVASKNGTKYYFPWCTGANRISPVNKVTFASYEQARAKGFTPASGCKGLK